MDSVIKINKSTNVKTVMYDGANQQLTVTFMSGVSYKYKGVPIIVADGFGKAESPGAYFAANIKGKYEYANASKAKEQEDATKNG